MIKGLHHNAYRCRDSEETRRFYEGFLGLPLANTLEIRESRQRDGTVDRSAQAATDERRDGGLRFRDR